MTALRAVRKTQRRRTPRRRRAVACWDERRKLRSDLRSWPPGCRAGRNAAAGPGPAAVFSPTRTNARTARAMAMTAATAAPGGPGTASISAHRVWICGECYAGGGCHGCSCGAVALTLTEQPPPAHLGWHRRDPRRRLRAGVPGRASLSSAAPEGPRWSASSVPSCRGSVSYEVRLDRSRSSDWARWQARRSRDR